MVAAPARSHAQLCQQGVASDLPHTLLAGAWGVSAVSAAACTEEGQAGLQQRAESNQVRGADLRSQGNLLSLLRPCLGHPASLPLGPQTPIL